MRSGTQLPRRPLLRVAAHGAGGLQRAGIEERDVLLDRTKRAPEAQKDPTPKRRCGVVAGGDTELYLSSLLGAPMELTNPHRKWFSSGEGVPGSGSGVAP